MNNVEDLIKSHIESRYVMQLATVKNGKPWSCSVYYLADDDLNLYWASIPSRRHSLEIADCPNVSVAISIEHEKGQKVIGIQGEGTAEIADNPNSIKPVAARYAEVFGRDKQWVEDFSSLKTEHRLYKFTPKSYVLFDEQNFPDNPRQELKIR